MSILKIKLKKLKIFIILGILSIVFMSLLFSAGYVISIIQNYQTEFKSSIEQQKRADARLLLRDVIDRFDHSIKTKQVDPSSIESVSNWATYNFDGLRNGSIHSNGFILELGTEKYISSNNTIYQAIISNKSDKLSTDILFNNNISKISKDAYERIKVGLSSTDTDNVSLKENLKIEWLEWAVYPTAISIGVNDEPKTIDGVRNSHYRKYVFLLKTDQSEVYKSYESVLKTLSFLIKCIYGLLILGFVFLVSIMFFLVYIEFHKKTGQIKNDKS